MSLKFNFLKILLLYLVKIAAKLKGLPPPRQQLALDRAKYIREQLLRSRLKEIIFYGLFLGLTFYTIFSMLDQQAFVQTQTYMHGFVRGNWKLDPRRGVSKLDEACIYNVLK